MAVNKNKMACDDCGFKTKDPKKSKLNKKVLIRPDTDDGQVLCEECYTKRYPKEERPQPLV